MECYPDARLDIAISPRLSSV